MGTFIVSAVVLCIIGLAAHRVYKDRKSGEGCGHGCENCSGCSGCVEPDGSK